MPKISWLKSEPLGKLQLTEDLFNRFGGMMCLEDVAKQLGHENKGIAREFVASLPVVKLGRSKAWLVEDVAAEIWRIRTEAANAD